LLPERRNGQLADPEGALERPAARLAAGELTQRLRERGELVVERVVHGERDLDPLARRGGQIESGKELASPGAAQLGGHASYTVAEQRRLDLLQPGPALVDQRLAQAGASAPLAHVRRRDPGLGAPPRDRRPGEETDLGARVVAARGPAQARSGQPFRRTLAPLIAPYGMRSVAIDPSSRSSPGNRLANRDSLLRYARELQKMSEPDIPSRSRRGLSRQRA